VWIDGAEQVFKSNTGKTKTYHLQAALVAAHLGIEQLGMNPIREHSCKPRIWMMRDKPFRVEQSRLEGARAIKAVGQHHGVSTGTLRKKLFH
jgi:hypothetical protein